MQEWIYSGPSDAEVWGIKFVVGKPTPVADDMTVLLDMMERSTFFAKAAGSAPVAQPVPPVAPVAVVEDVVEAPAKIEAPKPQATQPKQQGRR